MPHAYDEVEAAVGEEGIARICARSARAVCAEVERMRRGGDDGEPTLFPALRQHESVPASLLHHGRAFGHAYNAVVLSVRLQHVKKLVIPFFTEHIGPAVPVAMQSLVDGLTNDIADCVAQWHSEREQPQREKEEEKGKEGHMVTERRFTLIGEPYHSYAD